MVVDAVLGDVADCGQSHVVFLIVFEVLANMSPAALTTDAHKTKDDLVIGTDDSACVGSSELGEGVGACSGLVGENASDTAGCGCSL